MVDLLVRGVPEELVARYQHEAEARRISRNDALVEALTRSAPRPASSGLTIERWRAFMANYADLAEPIVMDAAWR